MARITVEDCLQNEPNLFNLVLLAAKRARRLANGAEATVVQFGTRNFVVSNCCTLSCTVSPPVRPST